MNAVPTVACARRIRPWNACTIWLFLWAIAATSGTHNTVAENAVNTSRFQRTVQYLQSAAPEVQSEFAATALRHLAEAYSAEAKLAREQARNPGQFSGLRGWSADVDSYARQVPPLLDDIALGMPVQLTITGSNALAIKVADRTLILNHPRLSQQSTLEQQILAEFCAMQNCQQFTPATSDVSPIPFSSGEIKPEWTFSSDGSACSYQGITVRFGSLQNLANARLICDQFMQEVTSLADEIAWQQRQGVSIDWDKVLIQSTPLRPEHSVQLNEIGDSVVVTVPLLHRSPGLLAQILPWIRQRLGDGKEASIDVDASLYGW